MGNNGRGRIGGDGRQGDLQVLLQQPHMVHMLAQPPSGLGGQARLPAQHQSAAHALFEQADALGNGRRCHMQGLGGALETAFPDHSSQSGEGGIVEHEFSLSNVD